LFSTLHKYDNFTTTCIISPYKKGKLMFVVYNCWHLQCTWISNCTNLKNHESHRSRQLWNLKRVSSLPLCDKTAEHVFGLQFPSRCTKGFIFI